MIVQNCIEYSDQSASKSKALFAQRVAKLQDISKYDALHDGAQIITTRGIIYNK